MPKSHFNTRGPFFDLLCLIKSILDHISLIELLYINMQTSYQIFTVSSLATAFIPLVENNWSWILNELAGFCFFFSWLVSANYHVKKRHQDAKALYKIIALDIKFILSTRFSNLTIMLPKQQPVTEKWSQTISTKKLQFLKWPLEAGSKNRQQK